MVPAINYRTPFRVVAIIAAHNEADVIHYVVADLVENGVEVYFIDHASTDDTVAQVAPFLGRGVIHIERFPEESGRPADQSDAYHWCEILRRKEEVAEALGADWYIHADADEFRLGPWPDLRLADAFRLVDALGYSAVDFDVYDFRPTDNTFRAGADVRNHLRRYEGGKDFDFVQVKAWKNPHTKVDLAATGGHEARFPGRRLFPVPFILQHYPIRSEEHGRRKVLMERLPRFVPQERALGWHVQYDSYAAGRRPFLWKTGTLRHFSPERARLRAFERGSSQMLLLDELLDHPLGRPNPAAEHVANSLRRKLSRAPGAVELQQVEAASLALIQNQADAVTRCRELDPDGNLLARARLDIEVAHARATGNLVMARACGAARRRLALLDKIPAPPAGEESQSCPTGVVPPAAPAPIHHVQAVPHRLDTQVALANLAEISQALRVTGASPWLTDGTLLGFHREGDFIGHDCDTDLGIAIADWSPTLVASLEQRGFRLAHTFGRVEVGLEYAFVRNGVKTDLFFFYPEGRQYWHGAWRECGGGKRNLIKYYYTDFFPLRSANWRGKDFLVPNDIEKYVVTKYGDGWRTPVRDWDWAYSPKNHVRTDFVL